MKPSIATLLSTPARRRVDHVDLAAPPGRVWRAVSLGNLGRLRAVKLLLRLGALRNPGQSGPTSLRLSELRSTPLQPGLQLLVEDAPRCLIFGAIVDVKARRTAWVHVANLDEFSRFNEPGAVKLAWSVELQPRGARDTRLILERRVAAIDAGAWTRFAWWWLGLGPLERLVQRRWFAALVREFGAAELVHGWTARAQQAIRR